MPPATVGRVGGLRDLWAPDISKVGGEFRMYYSASKFGTNDSVIALATATVLDPAASAGTGWTDKGVVIDSRGANYNAIDPNFFVDREGRQWLAFGSFFRGIKMIRIDPATGVRLAADPTVHSVATRLDPPNAIEAPFVIERSGFYYLFVSFDACCRGSDSTYYTVVGRAQSPTGPYADRAGKPMMEGGGTPVLEAAKEENGRFAGPGHIAILRDTDRDYIVYHAYDRNAGGARTLRIREITWSADGWPSAQ